MRIGILLYHHVNELEVVGPYSVLHTARALLEQPEALEVCSVAKSRNSVQTQAEMTITPSWAFASAPPLSGLIVPGGVGVEAASRDRALRRYLESLRGKLEVLGSVGSGALILGELGFLRGQVVTTQPGLRERLEDFEVLRVAHERVVPGARVLGDGVLEDGVLEDGVPNDRANGLWSASDGAAGMALALALVRTYFGDDVAERVAERLGLE